MDISNISDKELLSITLKESLDSPVITELTNRYQDICGLSRTTLLELTRVIGSQKAAAIMAAFEFSKRVNMQPKPTAITSPDDVFNLFNDMQYLDREHMRVILLNTKNHIIETETVHIGTLNSMATHAREVYKKAIIKSAANIILVHNHPSGDPTPSEEDLGVTKKIQESGDIIGIELLDHVIIGCNSYVSLKNKNLM